MKSKNLFLFIFFILTKSVSSQEIATINNPKQSLLIGKSIYILKDELGQMSFSEVVKSKAFVKSEVEVPNLGVSSNTYWLRFKIKNETKEEMLLLEFSQPFTNQAHLFCFNSGSLSVQISGDDYPFSYRRYEHPNMVYLLPIKSNEVKEFFMKIKSNEQILLPLTLGTRHTIIKGLHLRDLIFGIYAGIMIVMILYNLFIYFFAKENIYLRYVFYTIFIFLTQASILGYPNEFIWPNSPYMANIAIDFFSCCVGITSLWFLRPFLHTKEYVPRLNKVSYFITGMYLFGLLVTFSGYMNAAYLIIQANAVIVATYMLVVALVISRTGFKPAIFFLVAWSSMLVGIIIFVMKDFGFLPTNFFTSYTMPIGSALETVLLAIALADKINSLKKEKEQSQAEALAIAQQNQKLVAEQNVILEQRVHERTLELEETNEELNVTLSYLKDTQAQLVNAEKMASLGQLTAGIAHEINNPINFVSANLKPLQTDISEVFEVIKLYEAISINDNFEEKLKEVERFKNKVDYEYLKQEIAGLLKGIDDGARRTAEIVSGLKNFSRLDESDIKEANVNEGIESTLILVRNAVPNNTEIITELGDLPFIECYPGKLNQVFMNILTNAIYAVKHKPEDSENKITIVSKQVGDKIHVIFHDTGIGMTKEVKEKIFEPFFTTKDVGEGTGLGMSIVYKIIESHHAKLEVESELGVGTTLTLILNQRIGSKNG
jgi:two-component system, NtrC family, sensor kinase